MGVVGVVCCVCACVCGCASSVCTSSSHDTISEVLILSLSLTSFHYYYYYTILCLLTCHATFLPFNLLYTQVPSKHLKTGKMLAKALTNLLTPKAEKIETTQDLRTKCLDKPICGLLLKGSKQSPNYIKDAMSKLVTEHPAVTFGAIDSSNLYVKGLEAEYLDEFQQDKPRFVVFQKVSGSTSASSSSGEKKDKKDTGRLKTSLVTLDDNVSVGYGPMSNLVANVVLKKANMQKVPALPTVKTRTKKLVEEERKKRQRRTEQKDRASSGSGGSGGAFSSSGENDGSAEGRRAERERRREEHRRKHNVKPKTPEEIAEMERRRRQRMEEESAKWNVADEDLGDLLDGDGDGDSSDNVDWDVDDDDDDENKNGGGGADDDDDEDVMDLD